MHFFSASKIFLLIIVVVVSVWSSGLLHSSPVSTTTIEISSRGFNPGNVTISQGEQVTFVVVDDSLSWPASNIHPTHSLYPGSDVRLCNTLESEFIFDACGSLGHGDTYTFRFHESGDWLFHDHLKPRFAGRIVVTAVENYSPPLLYDFHYGVISLITNIQKKFTAFPKKLKELPGAFQARIDASGLLVGRSLTQADLESDARYEDGSVYQYAFNDTEIRRVVYQLGIARTMEKILEESENGVGFDCHIGAHYVGRAGYDVFGKAALKECSAACHSGCYHGAMEAFFWEHGSSVDIRREVNATCSSFESAFARQQCFHGAGHGFLALSNYDVPDSIETCDALESSEAAHACYGGVFMENVVTAVGLGASTEGHVTDWLSLDDPNFPCTLFTTNSVAQEKCYQMQTSWMLVLFGNDYTDVGRACLDAPDAMVAECFKSLGRDIAGNNLRNPETIESLCSITPDEYYPSCILGGVNAVIDFWGVNLHDEVSQFCDALPEGNAQTVCYERLIERTPELFPDSLDQARVCNTMRPPYNEYCLSS